MSISDELDKLGELHRRGDLSDDEFTRAKARVLGEPMRGGAVPAGINALRRSRSDRWLGGVCGGLARVTRRCRVAVAAGVRVARGVRGHRRAGLPAAVGAGAR
jgi:hypothetical protein